jgi:hypothetical protein
MPFSCLPLCHMPCQSHPPSFEHANNIWWWVQIMKLYIKSLNYLKTICRCSTSCHNNCEQFKDVPIPVAMCSKA